MEWINTKDYWPSLSTPIVFLDEWGNYCFGTVCIHGQICEAMDELTKKQKKFTLYYPLPAIPPELNTVCKECGEKISSSEKGFWKTTVNFWSPEGHDHDDNCKTKQYLCKNGHQTRLSIINK